MIPLDQLQNFLHFLTIPFLNLNFIDIAIVVVILAYAFEGYVLGFIKGMADFISFVISFIFALSFYGVFGTLLINGFNIPKGIGNALGFFLGAFICEVMFTLILRFVFLPIVIEKTQKFELSEKLGGIAGIFPGILSAIVLLAFVLTMIVALPLSSFLKNSVSTSRFGEPLVSNIQGFDKQINNVFGGAVNDALTFLTVEPKSQDLLKLNFQTSNIHIDTDAEDEMLSLVNKERKSRKIKELAGDSSLREDARNHCTDMFERGYFSHYTPEGNSPFDRMQDYNIQFTYAGENLALAPSTKLAMQGLMNSSGHKANILSKNFGKVGIGTIDGGIYGEMFCQEFTN